jgi:two-component system, NtrC family, sensor histidine kinase HydH
VEGEKAMAVFRKLPPLWVANSLVFLILFFAVVGYFFWQSRLLKQAFLNHARQHAAIVSEVIRLNAKGAFASQKSIEDLLQHLLENTARFVAYLDGIEPFDPKELAAFTKESGLAGISVIRSDGTRVNGPENWTDHPQALSCSETTAISHLPGENLYVLSVPEAGAGGCLVLGIDDEKITVIQKRLGLENVIDAMTHVPGIAYIRIGLTKKTDFEDTRFPAVIKSTADVDVAEARLLIDGKELAVGVNAGHLVVFIRQLRAHLFLFGSCLALAGVGLSFVLHRYQIAVLDDVKRFERELSLQREDAILGRSASGIAHEIRNPLNTLNMGLQRLEMENACKVEEHRKLIRMMLGAVNRANSSVTGLLDYARPRKPRIEKLDLASLVSDMLGFYEKSCDALQIRLTSAFDFNSRIESDSSLLSHAIENIVKNAIDAQPEGGFIHCGIRQENREVVLMFRNEGCSVAPRDAQRILEPYFTTRVDGTGLGMAIVHAIVKSLGGRIDIRIMEQGVIETRLYFPLSDSSKGVAC